jgi:fructokinase
LSYERGKCLRPLIFGEVLFDIYPGGDAVLGGAPFNVAWNLKGFGLNPLVISSVGRDRRGSEAIEAMEKWGLDTSGIYVDEDHPTGEVTIDVLGDSHTFQILPDRAYDFIPADWALPALPQDGISIFCHGSLASRSAVSRKSLRRLMEELGGVPRFYDVNLRKPFYRKEEVTTSTMSAEWVKMNDDELRVLSGRFFSSRADLEKAAAVFRKKNGIENLLVTMGKTGAVASFSGASSDASIFQEPFPVDGFADSVGAGDAFSSVVIFGILNGWELGRTFERAARFASEVCGIMGAISGDRGLYGRFIERCEND